MIIFNECINLDYLKNRKNALTLKKVYYFLSLILINDIGYLCYRYDTKTKSTTKEMKQRYYCMMQTIWSGTDQIIDAFYGDHLATLKDILVRFKNLLGNYLKSKITKTIGLPTVKYCADQLHLSANYFGDLIKKETGKTALDHIQLKLIEIAKEKVFDKSKSISEIAYALGFKHPQHFSRMFKSETGYTPLEYRSLN